MDDQDAFKKEIELDENNLNELSKVRREKLRVLKENGKDPFKINSCKKDASTQYIKDNFENIEGNNVFIAGRILSFRDMGKASFIDISDCSGKIQNYVRSDEIDNYDEFLKWDIGDIVSISGKVFKTRRGEISIRVSDISLISKSLLPLPEKFHGLRDTDLRYRQRYLDLIVNPEVKKTFLNRSGIISEIRSFLNKKNFLEVETPILNVIPGGAIASPFLTHHNALDLDLYLRIAPELYLKRLLVGGFEKVYEIGRLFRNEGISVKHNPEFTIIELYEAYSNYYDMMNLTEELVSSLVFSICGKFEIEYCDEIINFSPPFKRITMIDAVKEVLDIDFSDFAEDTDKAREIALSFNVEEAKELNSWGEILNLVFEEKVEETLLNPTFLCDYPIEVSPLTKKKIGFPYLTERFEFFVARRELANAYSELNDPIEQRERFLFQLEKRDDVDYKKIIDEDFLTALEYGMPPAGGLGIGIDRLVMILTNSTSIRDVLLFPTMKPIY
ncbi:MAG: lysine--tRNA ligase [Oscillospiraceae bacterium]|jgi:lysyl-tRNA synthetase class 2|nr:lysine--tRNA ligase [Oscillospiraceae bacterium]